MGVAIGGQPEFRATYEIHFSSTTGNWHYTARLLCGSEEVARESGCSIAPPWWDWNMKACRREAIRACRRMIKRHRRAREAEARGELAGTVTA